MKITLRDVRCMVREALRTRLSTPSGRIPVGARVIVDYGRGERRRGWIDGHIPSSQGGTPGYWVEFDDAELLRGADGEMQPATTTFMRLSGETSTYLDMSAADVGLHKRATIRRERGSR